MKLARMLEITGLLLITFPTLSSASDINPDSPAVQTDAEKDPEEQNFVDVFDVAEQKLKEREQEKAPAQALVTVPEEKKTTPPLRIGGAVTLGLGAAALVAGSVTGGLALSVDNDLDETKCPDGQCFAEYSDDVDRRDNLALATNILVIAGGVTAVAGVLMVIFSYPEFRVAKDRNRKTETVSIRPIIGRSVVGTQISVGF